MRRAILILLLLAVAGGGAWLVWHRSSGGTAAARRNAANQPVPVLVATARSADVPIWLDGLGTVQAFNSVTVRSMIDGPLVEVRFQEGQDVRAGDVLARIDPRPYQAALDQAVAKKAQDDATLANARLDLIRYIKLAQTSYTTQQQADTQKSLVAQDEAIVRQDQAQIDTAQTNLSYTTIAAPLAGRTGIRQVDAGNIIHTTDTNGLVVVTQLQPISVLFTLPQQALGAVRAAMQAGPVAVQALPQGAMPDGGPPVAEGAGPGLAAANSTDAADPPSDPPADPPAAAPPAAAPVLDRGTLAVLDNEVDQTTGTIKLKATFPNPHLTLWPGGFVNVRVLVDTERQVVTVPPAAVQRGPNGTYVYVLAGADGIARRTVRVGHEDEQVAVIAQGIGAGDQVITDGASRLRDGSHVRVMSPEAATPTAAAPARSGPPGVRRRQGNRPS
jgi:multidrug efflux system membrane fusion protein